jgi:hypothetical protein
MRAAEPAVGSLSVTVAGAREGLNGLFPSQCYIISYSFLAEGGVAPSSLFTLSFDMIETIIFRILPGL